MKIRTLDTRNSKDVHAFVEFPFQLYRKSKLWVPSLTSEIEMAMDRDKHPFYKHSEADFLVVESEHDILGQVAVIHNRNYCAHHKIEAAFIYYFDVADDVEASRLLLKAVKDWAAAHGIVKILGPKGFLRANGLGVLVDGFEYLPAVSIPYNFPYYASFLEDAGFVKETDHFSGYIQRTSFLPERMYEVANKVKTRGNFWIKTFKDKEEMRTWIPRVEAVHNEAFSVHPWYYPSTEAEFEMIASSMIQIAQPGLMKLIMKGEEVAGFIISYPDISEGIQKSHGRMFPFGWAHILSALKNSKTVDMNGLGILPKYQGLGSNALLYTEVEKTLRDSRFERLEIVQVDERNFKSKADMDTIGTIWHKLHRTYRYFLN
jgi:hypothetical protein